MKRSLLFLVFICLSSSVSVLAQSQPKPATKSAIKNECKKGSSCCSGNNRTAKAAPKASVKKN